VISAMGAGGRLDPTRVRVGDISSTHTDPLARIVRDLLRQQGIEQGVRCVWSDEPPNDLDVAAQEGFVCICPDKANSPAGCDKRFQVQGSVAWMPSVFGLTMAAAAAGHLMGREVIAPTPDPRYERMAASRKKLSRSRKNELLVAAGLRRVEPDGTTASTD
jgi:tRNA threonylcarbamoyladenosine dehydratase